MKNIVFLVSGNGGTLKFLYNAIKVLKIDFEIIGVIADRECESLSFAKKRGIFQKQIIYNRSNAKELRELLSILNPDIIVTNIHKIIDEETLNLWTGKFLNVHYSILPSFGGLIGMETITNAKKQNVKFIGATCHQVSKDVDAGTIIHQSCFSIDWNDDALAIDTVFKTACLCLLGSIYKSDSNIKTSNLLLNNYSVSFSPPLQFNYLNFDNDFWNNIKIL